MRCVSRSILVASPLVAAIPGASLARTSEHGSTAIEQLRTLREDLRRTHAANDTAAYLSSAQAMHDFLNGSPTSILQLMLAEVVAGRDREALESLQQFVRMGQSNEDVLRTKQFDGLRAQPQYSSLQAAMVSNELSKSVASKVFGLTEAKLLPEDIDYDPTTKLFYITSVLKKEIVAVDMTGTAHVFVSGPDKWPMMGVKGRCAA